MRNKFEQRGMIPSIVQEAAKAIGEIQGTRQFLEEHQNGDRKDAVRAVQHVNEKHLVETGSHVVEAIKQSIPVQVVDFATTPLRAGVNIGIWNITGHRYPTRYTELFGPHPKEEEKKIEIEDTFASLTRMSLRISGEIGDDPKGEAGMPKNYLRHGYHEWLQIKKNITQIAGDGVKILNYVTFDSKNECHTVYVLRNQDLIALPISQETSNPDNMKRLLENPMVKISVTNGADEKLPSRLMRKSLTTELDIVNLQERMGLDPKTSELQYISPNTNAIPSMRDAIYERYGVLNHVLDNVAATRYGELNELERTLPYGIQFDSTNGIQFKPEFSGFPDQWIKTYGYMRVKQKIESGKAEKSDQSRMMFQEFEEQYALYSEPSSDEYQEGEKALLRHAREIYYTNMVAQYLKENPEGVIAAMRSPAIRKYERYFKNSHAAAFGHTKMQIYRDMLVNIMKFHIEGNSNTEESPSQQFMEHSEKFIEEGTQFILDNQGLFPELPIDCTDAGVISSIVELHNNVKSDPYTRMILQAEKREHILAEAKRSHKDIYPEIYRGLKGRKVVDGFNNKSPWKLMDNDEHTLKIDSAVFGSLLLVRVPKENRVTMASRINTGYYPDGSEVLPYDPRESQTNTVEDAIRYIFNGQTFAMEAGQHLSRDNNPENSRIEGIDTLHANTEEGITVFDATNDSAYESQVAKMWTEGPVILRMLTDKHETRVPKNVRKFASRLVSRNFPDYMLEGFDPANDAYSQTPGKFFKQDGVKGLQKYAVRSFVDDVIRGVETELLLQTSQIKIDDLQAFAAEIKNDALSAVINESTDQGASSVNVKDVLRKVSGRLFTHETKVKAFEAMEGMVDQLRRIWIPRWRNFDFSQVSPEMMQSAITETMQVMNHRIDYMAHKPGVKEKYLKDFQIKDEITWAHLTPGAKYTPYIRLWGQLVPFLLHSECPCPAKYNHANSKVLPLY